LSVLLDTHVWVWWLTRDAALTPRERAALNKRASRGGVRLSAISLWEVQMLHAKRRLRLPGTLADWLHAAASPEVLAVLPLDAEVALALDGLPASFHGDPADRVIAATARAHVLPLATHDRAIRRSRAVPIWNP
jgi:PIN domain nuclease of toxin-antitoxin system